MKDGAIDFLTKPVEDVALLAAIRVATDVSASVHARAEELRSIRERAETLTPREREVMALVATGMLNKQIAYDLGTSEKTIKVHRARVMEKMCVSSVAALVRLVDRLDEAQRSAQHGTAAS
jgi:FixJ family two-component response regulator